MTRLLLIALPFAFLFSACDTPDATPNDDAIEVDEADILAPADGEKHGRGGKLARLDTDKDGALSLSEAQAHPRLAEKFTELDTDKDGKLSKDELKAMKGKHGKHGDRDGDKSPAERAAHKLAKFDSNGDKVLTLEEVKDHRFFADKFAEIDTDKDGKLTLDELTAAKAKHGGKHGDHDGKGWHGKSPEERATMIFTKLDSNADKVLTQDEVKNDRFAGMFAAADTDKDGKLTQAELIAFKPTRPERTDAPAVR